MYVISKINNSAVLCRDANGDEVVAFGKGLGFCELGAEVDLARIQRTFYGLDSQSVNLLGEIDSNVMSLATQVTDLVRDRLEYQLSTNFAFVLADHLDFVLKRVREGISVRMPLAFDVEQQYPLEYEIGVFVCKRMNSMFDVSVPYSEATGIALCFVNNMDSSTQKSSHERMDALFSFDELLERSIGLVEQEMKVEIDRSSFNFSRFATHLQYLYDRMIAKESLSSGNVSLYPTLQRDYPIASGIADDIASLCENELAFVLSEEELLYLILHINRLCEKAQVERGGDG